MPSNHTTTPPPPNPEILVRRPSTPGLRQQLFDKTYEITRKGAFSWQLDVAEALCNRRDVMCIAGTGKGKTLAFVMPYFVDPQVLIWIVSPLNYIQQQQERQFRNEWNIPACSVNATTSYPGLHKDILSGKYRVIITSPERLLEFNKLRPIIIQLGAQNWNNIVIVDGCHCICIWSDQFRKTYGLLGTLRIFLLPGTPFCAATATATNSMQKQIRASLRFTDDSEFVNEGYWRPNLSWHVHYMEGSDSSIGEIIHMLPRELTPITRLPVTIIFVDQRKLGFGIFKMLFDHLPKELRGGIEIYHALQSQLAKDIIAERFEKGLIRILICTEALTMGCDFRNIELVILFKVPKTLSTVLQRGGRGVRDAAINCRIILMVEASKHKKLEARPNTNSVKRNQAIKQEENAPINGSEATTSGDVIGIDDIEALEGSADAGAEDDDETANAIKLVSAMHGKEDEDYLQQFYMPGDHCRTLVLDTAFCSPPHDPCIKVNGCDNCIRRRISELETKSRREINQNIEVKQEPLDVDIDAFDTGKVVEDLRRLLVEPRPKKPAIANKPRAKYRAIDERAELEEHLFTWRQSAYETDLRGTGMSVNHIITDKIVAAIACILPPLTLDALAHTTPPWPKKAHSHWGVSLLAIVNAFDAPSRTAERKAERIRLKQMARPKGIGKKDADVIKVEDVPSSSNGKKRAKHPAKQVVAHTAKKQRILATTTAADSALSAGPPDQGRLLNSPRLTQNMPTRPSIHPKSELSSPSASLNMPSQSPITPPTGLSGHYRAHLYAHSPSLRESITEATLQNRPTSPSASQTQSIGAQAVGTIRIPVPHTPGPLLVPPSTPDSSPTSSTLKNPTAKRSYYPEHLWR